jgi:hypothetical protein
MQTKGGSVGVWAFVTQRHGSPSAAAWRAARVDF